LVGRQTKRRYYGLAQASALKSKISWAGNTIAADPLESNILQILRSLFCSQTRVVEAVNRYVSQALATRPEVIDLDKLVAEESELGEKIAFIYATSDSKQLKQLQPQIVQLQARRNGLLKQIENKPLSTLMSDAPVVAKKLSEALDCEIADLDGEAYEKLRLLLAVICRRFTVNLESYEVNLEIALPEMFVRLLQNKSVDVSVPNMGDHLSIRHAHQSQTLQIGSFKLVSKLSHPDSKYATHFVWTEVPISAQQDDAPLQLEAA
jgi:hypothetical protein